MLTLSPVTSLLSPAALHMSLCIYEMPQCHSVYSCKYDLSSLWQNRTSVQTLPAKVFLVFFFFLLTLKNMEELLSKERRLQHSHTYTLLDRYRLMSKQGCDLCMSHQSDSHKGHICRIHASQRVTFSGAADELG